MVNLAVWLALIVDVAICYYVAMEFYESKATNAALTKVLNRQRKGRRKISVDKIIKDAVTNGVGQ